MPERPASEVQYVGPFTFHKVVVRGRVVPYLHARPVDGGKIDLTLDNRFALLLTVGEAERFVPFLADAIAVALGYTIHPDDERDGPNPSHPFPRLTALHDV